MLGLIILSASSGASHSIGNCRLEIKLFWGGLPQQPFVFPLLWDGAAMSAGALPELFYGAVLIQIGGAGKLLKYWGLRYNPYNAL